MHLGIIMDGNRRWADSRGLPALAGHKAGAEKLREVLRWCKERDVNILTLYAFSTENWSRSAKEVGFLMKLFGIYLVNELQKLHKEKIKLLVIGQREKLSVSLQKQIKEAEDLTKNNDSFTLVLAVSYGGRAEIARALRMMVQGGISPDDVTEEKIGEHLYTVGLPDPDLIIRTSGEIRTSNFLPWQSVYSEWYFINKYWPDFSEEDLGAALAVYAERKRRRGK